MNVGEFVQLLQGFNSELRLAFECDGGYSVLIPPEPIVYGDILVFHVGGQHSMDGDGDGSIQITPKRRKDDQRV